MRTKSSNEYELSTGQEFYAHRQTLGINPGLDIFEGYDGELSAKPYEADWTAQEKQEIAKFAIDMWSRWGGL